ncbi:MAG: hypothetical protein ACLVJO_01755 [[Clostridium] scindens]
MENGRLRLRPAAGHPISTKTLIAGGNMPDIIDIDADPYCKELDAGKLVDVKEFLTENDNYDILPNSA